MSRTIALIGLSGVGKSSVAGILGARLGRPVYDTDALVAGEAGRDVATIFATRGEEAFRDLESAALARVLGGPPAIVATGGGIVLRPANRELLREHAFVAWLDAPDAVLLERLSAHDERRPLLAENPVARLAALRAGRTALYSELATATIDTTGLTPVAVAAQILSRFEAE